MSKENNFSESLERIKEQTEVPVFPESRVKVFYSDYVDSMDEATDVLEEKSQSPENNNDYQGPYSRTNLFDK